MTRKIILLLLLALGCASCVSQKKKISALAASPEYQLYDTFNSALKAQDVVAVNRVLAPVCEFREYSSLPGWYSFYRDSVNTIGPFPLSHYADRNPLHLVRPHGTSSSDFTKFHVFGRHYDLFLVFKSGKVEIKGSGEVNMRSGTSQPNAPADADKPRR